MTTTREVERTTGTAILHVAFELGLGQWKLAFTVGLGQAPRLRTVTARDRTAVLHEIGRAKERFGLPTDTPVVSCYEAGRDGFWIHRWLGSVGVNNLIVDSSSIEVNRKKRRAKNDRLDAGALVRLLVQAVGRSGGADANPLPLGREQPRTRDQQSGEQATAAIAGRVGVELAALPTGLGVDTLVLQALW
jgi:transposase